MFGRKTKAHIFVATICFWKLVLFFCCPFKVTKDYKNWGFSRHRGKPKMALLVAKVPFWEGASKGALLSVIPKSCAPPKRLFFTCFQQSTALQTWKSVTWKKQTFTKNRGLLAKMQKGVFLVCFSFLVVLFFFFSVFLCFCFVKSPKKAIPAILELFFYFAPQKACFEIFLFFLFCFFLFSFCLPFQNPLFSLLLVHEPLFGTNSFVFFLLAFSFPNICLFLWHELS